MRLQALTLAVLLGLAACETVPSAMDPATFDTTLASAEANTNPARRDAELSDLIARAELSDEQRATALYARADGRLNMKFNLPGAMEDFDALLALAPEDARVATVERRKLFAAEEIEAAERRLARLQNLPDWVDDKILMGDIPAAAVRYQGSGLTPNAGHFYVFLETGFICAPADLVDAAPVHQVGPEPEHVQGAVWCSDPSVS
ncbi:MAG: hypothetical protein AAGL11_12945 [Pseudomonadota bacterium]